jgi:general secretion pathway protein C
MASRLLLRTLSGKPAARADVHHWLVPVATGLALGLAAWVATDWFWYFKGTQRSSASTIAAPAQQPDARVLAESLAASSVFGTTRTMVVAQSNANVKLKGVIASGPAGASAAIVNTGARDEVVSVGNDVAPGLILEAVYPTHVLVRRAGRIERVDIEERKSGASSQLGLAVSPRSQAGSPRPQGVPIAPMPPGMQPNQLPQGMPNMTPQSPQGGPPLGRDHGAVTTGRLNMTAAGPTVEEAPPGSLLARIGLQPGDIIKSIDGQPVQAGRDMVRLFQLGNSGETVRGEVLRGGQMISMQIGVPK